MHNLDTASTTGILFDAGSDENFELVQELYRNLGSHLKEIRVLGYCKSKELPNHYLFKKDFVFYQKKDLNWLHKPVKPEVDDFLSRPLDLLIDLSMSDDYHFQYIVAMSPAQLKVGHFIDGPNYYDLMIDIRKNPLLAYLIEQVTHYLGSINKPHFAVY